jgi:hypothetical protein
MRFKAMKTHGGNLSEKSQSEKTACCIIQLNDILEKAKPWRQ